MIDKRFQGKGYGKAALIRAIEMFRSSPQGEASTVYLSYNPENNRARKRYKSFGFVETGAIKNGEVVAKLVL